MINIDNVSLSFPSPDGPVPVLSGLTTSVARGEFVVLVGSSGVGKSTLLRVVAGLLKPTGGRAWVDSSPGPERRPVGFVFQDARLLPWRRVLDNVAFGLEGLAVTPKQARDRAETALARVGMADFSLRWPYELSGGQRQRVGIARALAVDPDVLLMDEPFGALDAITRTRLQDELVRIWEAERKTVLFVTHDLDEATFLGDRVLIIGGKPGRLVRDERNLTPRVRPAAGNRDQADQLAASLADSYEI